MSLEFHGAIRDAIVRAVTVHNLPLTATQTTLLAEAAVDATRPGPGRRPAGLHSLKQLLAANTTPDGIHLVWNSDTDTRTRVIWRNKRMTPRQISWAVHRKREYEGHIRRMCERKGCVADACIADRVDREGRAEPADDTGGT